nr:hypothetical protein [Tanacetum cinerariifolium]
MTGQDILCCRFCEVLFTAPILTMLKGFGNSLFNPYKPFSLTGRILLRLLVRRRRPLICLSQALGAPYYDEYQEHVAKYQQHLDDKHGKATEGGATKSSKATKNEEEENLQRALELNLKKQAERTQRLARPMVIKEPDSGRIQSLLETPKNKSPVDQFIFQRRTPVSAKASRPVESPSLDAKLALTDSETESDDKVPKINTGDQDEGQARPNPGIQDEEATDASTLQNPEQMDEEFTTTAYPREEDPGKTNRESEVQSMVSVPIDQETSSVPPMTTPTIDLTLLQFGAPFPTSTATTLAVTRTTIPPPPPQP